MQNIGKYELIEQIGVGGFGEVYKGRDPFIKRPVAVKTCSSNNEEIRSRFFQEAEIAGNLHHRNITTVYDFGVQDGMPYLVQEYLSGEDLDRKVKRRDYLPWPEKLFYLLQAARGLAYAHKRGVIHRDIKPANVRVLEDGTTKIMDFGIAKLAQQETGLTQTGMTLGTAAYLSPEQIRGGAIDVRTDIFSFGVLAYELLTYERPFRGEQISQVLYKLIHETPPPMTEHWPAAPRGIVELVDACLQKDPAARPADGEALVQELELLQRRLREEWSSSHAIETQPAPGDGMGGEGGGGAGGGGPAGRAAHTPQAAQDVTTAQALHPTETTGSLDEMELSPTTASPLPQGTHVTERPGTTSVHAVARSDDNRWTTLLAVLALALVAGGAGWWFGARDPAPASDDVSTVDVVSGSGSTAEDARASGTSSDGERSGSAANGAAGGGGDGAETTGDTTSENTADTAADTTADIEPVQTARLVVPALLWAERATLRVGGRSYSLARGQTIELDPGVHDLTFRVDDADYAMTRNRRVSIGEGESLRVSSPIPAPALLSVRPFPRRPQGRVIIDGDEALPTPLRRLKLEPGRHAIEVRPLAGDEPVLRRLIELESLTETILTFDLETETIEEATKEADE